MTEERSEAGQEQADFKKELTKIYSRIGDIESHLVNLIHPKCTQI
jgi:hypothetical protein